MLARIVPNEYVYIYIKWIWYWITYNGRYAAKAKQSKQNKHQCPMWKLKT